MSPQYLLLKARELCQDGDYFMLVQVLTRPWLLSVTQKIDLWQQLQSCHDNLAQLTFYSSVSLLADGPFTYCDPETGERKEADASEWLITLDPTGEEARALLDEDPQLPEAEPIVEGIQLVINAQYIYWTGYQDGSEADIETVGVPHAWFREQLAALETRNAAD